MPTHLVNLDAMIPREDFEEGTRSPEVLPQPPLTYRLIDLVGTTRTTLRKPDFQRETVYWTPKAVAEFIHSFVSGDLIPSIILWRSPTTKDVFIIDGAHRISALIAWIEDDYGDKKRSRDFFENRIPPEQDDAADTTRKLVKKLVGSFESLQSALKNPTNSKPDDLSKGRDADFNPIPLLWVTGTAAKAEESFYRINSKAVAIDPTELRIIKSRRAPSALAARAIVRGGVGHPYWKKFPEERQEQIREVAKSAFEVLFVPPLPPRPLETPDLPVAGRSYAGGDSLGLIFDFVSLANNLVDSTKNTRNKANPNTFEKDDADGIETVDFLKRARQLARRLSGKHESSLGLHPAVYFYGITGRYQATTFLAIVGLMKELDEHSKFNWFTQHRAKFEEFLLNHRYFTNQIVNQHGGRLKSYPALLKYYQIVLTGVAAGKPFNEIVDTLAKDSTFKHIKERQPLTTSGPKASDAIKTVVSLRQAIEGAFICPYCSARIGPRSISYDHAEDKRSGGKGTADNMQTTHPYCNSTYKDWQSGQASKAAPVRGKNDES